MIELLQQLALAIVPAVLAITLHEAAHGFAALALGDDTAKRMGRLSLNPLRHVDRVGTVLLPGALLIGQMLTIGRVGFMFGWAKPVPVSAWRFANPRRAMMLVAAAGPAMNFLLAWLGALGLHLTGIPGEVGVGEVGVLGGTLLLYFIVTNLALGLFNLLPIPPMDGGRIMVGLLPAALAERWARLECAGIGLVIVGIVLLPFVLQQFGIAFDPVRVGLAWAVDGAFDLVIRLAGLDP